MSNFECIKNHGGDYLFTKQSYINDKYIEDRCDIYLKSEYRKEKEYPHKENVHYRLHTKNRETFDNTLKYVIECPECHNNLRLVGGPINAYIHGLYTCPICNK